MDQLSSKKAIELCESKIWEDWTSEEIVKFQLWQEKLCVPFNVFHKAIEESLGRPVFTHEFGLNLDGIKAEFLHERPEPTFDEIMSLIPKEKLVLINISTRLLIINKVIFE